jgi:SAM-dependent methyltransferase
MTSDDTSYAKIAAIYDALATDGPYATLAPGNRGGRKSEYVAAVFDAALLPRLQAQRPLTSVLDFGCGTGIFTRQIAAHAREVIGIDVSPGMLEQATQVCGGLPNVRLLRTDGLRVPLPDSSVDVVVARETLCYVPEEQIVSLLGEISRVTRPGGAFLWLEQVSNAVHWQHHPRAPHLVKRSPGSLRRIAQRANWRLESEQLVRTPRFPWIYAVQAGLVPRSLMRRMAHWEVAIHSVLPHASRRWWNALFVLRKPADD